MTLRRWWPLGLGVALFAAAAWFTPGLWLRLDGWVQTQRDAIWVQFESAVGRRVVYDRIAPNVLAALDFQNVRLLAADGSPILTAASIRLSLDWGLILEGRFSQALRKVQIINGSVNLVEARDKALVDHLASYLQPGTVLGFEVEGFNLKARWTDGRRSLALDRGFVVVTPRGNQWGVRFRGAFAWDDPASQTWARLSLRGELSSDAAFENWSLRTEASLVRTVWFDLDPVTLQFTVTPQQVTIAKVADRVPLDLQATWDRTDDRWTFKGAADGFRPSRLLHLRGQKLWAGLADGTLTGRFSYEPGGDFSFSGTGDWPPGSWPAPFDGGAVGASGSVSTQAGAYRFEHFRLDSPLMALRFDGTLDENFAFPAGTLTLERSAFPGLGSARGTVDLSRDGQRIAFAARQVVWNELESDGAEGWVERRGSSWDFQVAGPLAGSAGQFSAVGNLDPWLPKLDVRLQLARVPLESIAQVWRGSSGVVPAPMKGLEATAAAHVLWSRHDTEVPEASFDLTDPGRPSHRLQGSGTWKGRELEVALGQAVWDGVSGSGSATVKFGDDAVDWTLAGRLWGRSLALSGRWVPLDKTLAFSGYPGISGSAHQDDEGSWTAQLTVAPLEVAPGWTVGLDTRATLRGSAWALEADKVSVTGRYPWNQEPFSFTTRLSADAAMARLDALVLNDAHGRLDGTAVSSWSADWSQPWSGRLVLATPESSREQAVIEWVGTAADSWHFTARAAGLDLARVPGVPVQGRLAVTGAVDWRGVDVAWNAQAALSEARWGDSPLGFRGALSGTARTLRVRNAGLSVNSLRLTDASLDLDVSNRSWTSAAGVGVRFGTSDWLSRWAASGSWTPPGQPFRSDFAVKAQSNTWASQPFPDARLTGRWGAEGWEASLGDGGLSAQGLADGSFHLKAVAPFPVHAVAEGQWMKETVSVAVHGFEADLAPVKSFVNSPLFSIDRGTLAGDFTMSGSLSDPEVNGRVVLKGVVMESNFVRQPLGPVDVPVVLEGHRVQVDPVNIGPAGQMWLVSGVARLDHFVPEEFRFTLQTDALSLIPVSYQYTGLSATGNVSGVLIVAGTPLAVTLGGRLALQDATITLKDTKSAVVPGLGFNADLTLVTGRKVEFLWPNENVPLLRAVAATNQNLAVLANDVTSTWSVKGKIGLKTGEVNYLNHTFLIKEGQLVFQENQAGFDPRIAVRAEYRVRASTGDVLVNLMADGFLSRFSPRFDAEPYQTPEQLQQLVGTTLAVPTDYTNSSGTNTALSVATDVGTSFLLTPFENTVKKNFKLDLFTVQTEILKRSLLNRNGPLEAADYLDNTRLYFGKYIGDDLFLQGTLAFSQGIVTYNQDGTVTTQEPTTLVIEPELLMEFQTPFFLLDWDLLPRHPETLFVTDNTVTFRWNWSY